MFNDKSILITGGTGSFGKCYTKTLLERYKPKKIVIFSRDELKQFEMAQTYNASCMRYFLGDVRDESRLKEATIGIDYIIHAAALKQVRQKSEFCAFRQYCLPRQKAYHLPILSPHRD